MKNNFIWAISIILLLFSCQSKDLNKTVNPHLEFKNIDTTSVAQYFGNDFVNKLSQFSKSDLSGVYILEVQNLTSDSILIPFSYSNGFPVYSPSQIDYLKSINDTVLSKSSLVCEFPSYTQTLAKNEKKSFLTSFSMKDTITRLTYHYFSALTKNDKKAIEIDLIQQNNQLKSISSSIKSVK